MSAARNYSYYDSDGNELVAPHSCPSRWAWDQAMPDVEPPRWFKGFGYVYGYLDGVRTPVARIVAYKAKDPSLHKCDARCRNAKGPNCECSCRGKNHGLMAA